MFQMEDMKRFWKIQPVAREDALSILEGVETQSPSQGSTPKGKEFVPIAVPHIYATRWQKLM